MTRCSTSHAKPTHRHLRAVSVVLILKPVNALPYRSGRTVPWGYAERDEWGESAGTCTDCVIFGRVTFHGIRSLNVLIRSLAPLGRSTRRQPRPLPGVRRAQASIQECAPLSLSMSHLEVHWAWLIAFYERHAEMNTL